MFYPVRVSTPGFRCAVVAPQPRNEIDRRSSFIQDSDRCVYKVAENSSRRIEIEADSVRSGLLNRLLKYFLVVHSILFSGGCYIIKYGLFVTIF